MRYFTLFLFVFLLPLLSFATAPITGTLSLCQAGTTTLSDGTPGGSWASGNTAIAVVAATGVVTGVSAGTATITYTEIGGFAIATVTVDPVPVLSGLTSLTVCDSTWFRYTPASTTPGVAFSWSRPFTLGIDEPAGSGTGDPREWLKNTTPFPIAVIYTYTLTAGSCPGIQTVTLTVNPTPRLTSSLTASVCSGSAFTYVPTSFTPATTFSWLRNHVPGIKPVTAYGSGTISETLTDTTSIPLTTFYVFRLSNLAV